MGDSSSKKRIESEAEKAVRLCLPNGRNNSVKK